MDKRFSAGFSLFELMVVIAIIGMVSALAIPRLVMSLEKLDLKTAAKKTAAVLRFTRNRVVSQQIPLLAEFDLDAEKFAIKSLDQLYPAGRTDARSSLNPDWNPEQHLTVSEIYTFPAGVDFKKARYPSGVEIGSGKFRIRFSPNGSSSGGEIILSGTRKHQFKICVDRITGGVQLQSQ